MLELLLETLTQEARTYTSETAYAKALGIPQQTLNDILNGRAGIGTKTLTRILEARPAWVNLLNHQPGGGGDQPEEP